MITTAFAFLAVHLIALRSRGIKQDWCPDQTVSKCSWKELFPLNPPSKRPGFNIRVCFFQPNPPSTTRQARRAPDLVILVLRVGFCVLVLRLNFAFRKKQIYLPLVFVAICFFLLFPVPSLFRGCRYPRLMVVPLVVYSGRWAVTCSRLLCTRF